MSLSTSLSIAVQALNASSANTPGYSRQVAILQEAAPAGGDTPSPGNGVLLEGYQSVRDEIVQTQIQQETQSQSAANAQLASMQQIQPTFTTSTQDIGTQMSALFASISSLSTDPTSTAAGEAVITAGQNLATAFNGASSALTTQQTGLNSQVTQDVKQINELTQQIAALNPQISAMNASGQSSGVLEDQQNQLVLSLSALTNVSTTQTNDGVTLTTGNGAPLVVGSQSFALQTATGTGGMQQVLDQNGTNITASLTSGDLGGTIQTRDGAIPDLLDQLDTLANQFGTAINAAQAQGFDQSGNAGQNFFSIPTTVAGSAAGISMAIRTPTSIAASSDGVVGSNGNLANISAVQTNTLASGQTPGSAYSSLVYQVGTLTSNADAESTATTASLLQLSNQLSSVSGVSIDQESTNLITYQTAYEAAARVVTTIQSLFTITMAMGTAAAE
jgi:flagellar hook-associated protein 1 FlgK